MAIEINTLHDIEELGQILKRYKLDSIRIGDIEIKKSHHESSQINPTINQKTGKKKTPDEILDEELGIANMPDNPILLQLGMAGR